MKRRPLSRAPKEGLERLQVNVPEPLLKKLEHLAAAEELSLSLYCRKVLRDHVEEKKNGTQQDGHRRPR